MTTDDEQTGMDEILAEALADDMTADELRKWCKRHGVRRERGDSKLDTARRAVRQNPVAATRYVLPKRSG